MSATWCHLNSPLSPRKITSCTRIARSPASGVKAIATSSVASAPHARDRYERSDHVLFLSGHMMCSLHCAPCPLTDCGTPPILAVSFLATSLELGATGCVLTTSLHEPDVTPAR